MTEQDVIALNRITRKFGPEIVIVAPEPFAPGDTVRLPACSEWPTARVVRLCQPDEVPGAGVVVLAVSGGHLLYRSVNDVVKVA